MKFKYYKKKSKEMSHKEDYKKNKIEYDKKCEYVKNFYVYIIILLLILKIF